MAERRWKWAGRLEELAERDDGGLETVRRIEIGFDEFPSPGKPFHTSVKTLHGIETVADFGMQFGPPQHHLVRIRTEALHYRLMSFRTEGPKKETR